jgi:DNA-binding PucR family transcriptional regulator
MSEMVSTSIVGPSFFDKMNPTFGLENSPGYLFVDFVSRFMSPYQLNPFDISPLRNLLNELVNLQRVRQQQSEFMQDVLRGMTKDDGGVSEHSTSRSFLLLMRTSWLQVLFKKELTESEVSKHKEMPQILFFGEAVRWMRSCETTALR